jgi:hypothetical protein
MKAKWTGAVAKAGEYLLCNSKALSSNLSPSREREGERENMSE